MWKNAKIGTGKRKNPLQRSIETLEEYLAKLKEYTKKIHTCGERNSFSKTDEDATFMRMKEDHISNEKRDAMIKGWNKAVKYSYNWAKED